MLKIKNNNIHFRWNENENKTGEWFTKAKTE